ncbi:MAG: hypothetical protein IPF99_16205 [Deltaproteobacteria bacterium]|nr:hypothetical protein [Deltaproteobacteria bacterium]
MIRRALLPLMLMACTAREARPAVPTTSQADPRQAVSAWSQVERFHCERGADGAPVRCATDGDCTGGRVCDASSGCGCCVPPPPRVEPNATLRRYMFTACAQGRCAPPRFCEPSADGATCTMRFDREVALWMSPWVAPQGSDVLAETRRALCILVEPGQDCMWTLEIPGGEYTADAPMPTRYEGSYECGGRTCNGVEALRASPRVGSSYTVRLTAQHCGG